MKYITSVLIVFTLVLFSCAKKQATTEEQEVKVHSMPSGLKYIEIIQGTGEQPKSGMSVTVHQIISTEDGNIHENTYETKKPFTFILGSGDIIKGMNEGVSTMRVGGKRKLFVPSKLAFGRRAVKSIPSNSDIIIELELLSIK